MMMDFFRKDYQANYKFSRKSVVYFLDRQYKKIRTMRINHRMSGRDYDDWEYYHCSCIDPRKSWENETGVECGLNVFGQSVCEISQKNLFETREEAQSALSNLVIDNHE